MVSIKELNQLLWKQPATVDLNNKYFKLFNVVIDESEQGFYYDYTPLQWACAHGKIKMIDKLLLFQQAYPSPMFKRNLARAMITACKYNRLSSVTAIVKTNTNLDVNFSTMGTTPFLYACMKRRVGFVKLYLDKAKLHDAIYSAVTVKNNQQVIDLLVSAGCKINPCMLMKTSHSTNIEHLVNSVPQCSNYLQEAFDHILDIVNATASDTVNDTANGNKQPSRGEYLNRLDIIAEFLDRPKVTVTF